MNVVSVLNEAACVPGSTEQNVSWWWWSYRFDSSSFSTAKDPTNYRSIFLYKKEKGKKPRKRKSFDVKHGPFYRAVNLHLPWAMHIPFTLKNNLIFLYNIFFLLFYSGAIRTRAVLDRESQANYWLTVVAQDHGIVSLSTSIDVRFCLHFRF